MQTVASELFQVCVVHSGGMPTAADGTDTTSLILQYATGTLERK